MIRQTLAMATLALGGCAIAPHNLSEFSPEQLQAIARDKSAVISCTTARYLTGSITTVFISIDMSRFDGVAAVTEICNATAQVSKPEN